MNGIVRPVEDRDFDAWYRMRTMLWPHATTPEDEAEMWRIMADDGLQTLVAEARGQLVGFAEMGKRPYADGCNTRDVGYLEGWFVVAEFRGQGIGAALVRAAEEWARTQGCREMASDCSVENEVSRSAHAALGYQEKERLVHFGKVL